MTEHMEGRGVIRFMGQHELVLDAEFDWDAAGEAAAVSGVGRMKMLKWLIYPFTAETRAERLPDGAFTGYVGLTKGLRLAIEGKRVA